MTRVFIRADASLAIGTGHVMRCLVLADALKERGADVHFLCRAHDGHLADLIVGRGFRAHLLPSGGDGYPALADAPPHAAWLGALPDEDAAACRNVIAATEGSADLLVVDHYALDHRFETPLRAVARRILVIDDLADRRHDCDVLIDQNFGSADPARYAGLVPSPARLLLGPRYALLRREFGDKRDQSLQRRHQPQLKSIMVFLGGVDFEDVTSKALIGIKQTSLPNLRKVDVILGPRSPFIEKIKIFVSTMPYETIIHVNTSKMAELMLNADLAIGAAGTSVLERFCLGLPSIVIPIADNQTTYAAKLAEKQLVIYIENNANISENIGENIKNISNKKLFILSQKTQHICDGQGVIYVLDAILDT